MLLTILLISCIILQVILLFVSNRRHKLILEKQNELFVRCQNYENVLLQIEKMAEMPKPQKDFNAAKSMLADIAGLCKSNL